MIESSVAMQGSVFAGELDCAFVGLGPAIGEEHLVEPAQIDQLVGKLDGNVVVVSRARGDQLVRLPADRVDDSGWRMAEAVDCPALYEIEIALAIVVPEPRAFAFDEDDWRPGGDLHECARGMGVEVHKSVLS